MASEAPQGRRISSTRSQAEMRYLPADIDVQAVIAENPNFECVYTLDALELVDQESWKVLEDFIEMHVVTKGLPLVIKNWHKRPDWPGHLFSPQWLATNHTWDKIDVRDLVNHENLEMSIGHYLRNLPVIMRGFQELPYDNPHVQRLYAKDIDCPPLWRDKLSEILPKGTFYLAPEADLMSSLPPAARAENMMCYIGHEGTYTPAHKEMCASLGQNIMVGASGEGQDAGSSIWFMTRSSDREDITEYWLSKMGHDIEVESHFASIDDLADAPFPVFIHEQVVGDYIIVPPLAPHQVWNRGRCTIKAAWNRITVRTLELAMSESLAKSRLVCRDEQYKNRAIVHETLKLYAMALTGQTRLPLPENRLKDDFVRLFKVFDAILIDECFKPDHPTPVVEKIDNEYNVTCSFCRGNIWNRFLSCKTCTSYSDSNEDDDNYDICLDCYARGRSCWCVSHLGWVEQHNWTSLEKDHEEFRQIVIEIQGTVSKDSPRPLWDGLKYLGRKSLAWVCQDELARRPFVDIKKNGLEEEELPENTVDKKKEDGRLVYCHVCKVRHDAWKCAGCATCSRSYCYGNLWRAFDLDPFDDVLSQFDWFCPVCLGVCSCGACRKGGSTNPYSPKGTYLGAQTKHVADPRSVEVLVDFSKGNLVWFKGDRKRKHAPEEDEEAVDTIESNIDPNLEQASGHGFTAINSSPLNGSPNEGSSSQPPRRGGNSLSKAVATTRGRGKGKRGGK